MKLINDNNKGNIVTSVIVRLVNISYLTLMINRHIIKVIYQYKKN